MAKIRSRTDPALDAQVDAVLTASRLLVGIAAQSMAEAEATVTLTQFRALVIVATRQPIHLAGLAQAMGVHPSGATRTCDRLVADGLLDRKDNPDDRRHLALTLTDEGRQLVESVLHRRRRAIAEVLERMSPGGRARLAVVLTEFAQAGGEPAADQLWASGWDHPGLGLMSSTSPQPPPIS